jgi:hypothetical protein
MATGEYGMSESFFCERCGHRNQTGGDRVNAELERLEIACSELRIAVDARGTVDTQGAAALLGRSVRTLEAWRSQGTGPTYLRGGTVRYSLEDLAEFLAHRLRDSTRRNKY